VSALWKDTPGLLDDVGRALASVDEDYAAFLAGERLTVTAAAQVALQGLVEAAERQLAEGTGEAAAEQGRVDEAAEPAIMTLGLFEEAGRDHFRRDLELRSLLYAYQAGGRVAWRHIAAIAVRQGLPAEALAALAEGVFRAVDRISAVSTNGYLLEQAESAGRREQLRSALAEQLLTGGTNQAALEQLAVQADWALPAEAAVVLVRSDDRGGPTALARLSPRGLPLRTTSHSEVIVPDPGAPGARQRLTTLLRGCRALVGPTVPLAELPDSARLTRDAAWVLDVDVVAQAPFFVDEHLDAIIVHRDPRVLAALRARVLAPLDGAGRSSRAAFQDTLRSWLVHMGDRRAVAAELRVHPQTVRYRLGRLRELFGGQLDDPDVRLELLLALAWG
jgi:PucR C-terminal helix-turn-helix domain